MLHPPAKYAKYAHQLNCTLDISIHIQYHSHSLIDWTSLINSLPKPLNPSKLCSFVHSSCSFIHWYSPIPIWRSWHAFYRRISRTYEPCHREKRGKSKFKIKWELSSKFTQNHHNSTLHHPRRPWSVLRPSELPQEDLQKTLERPRPTQGPQKTPRRISAGSQLSRF